MNFTLIDDTVVFRTNPETVLAAHLDEQVGFEADRLDEAMSRGWSVLLAGHARRVYDPAVFWRAHDTVEPWVGGEGDLCVRIEADRVSGRRISAP